MLILCSSIPPSLYCRWGLSVSATMVLPLYALVWWGTSVNGMRGWFTVDVLPLGPMFFQPSELAKPAYIIFLAVAISCFKRRMACDWKMYLLLLLSCAMWTIPIILQPDFGMLLVYVGGFVMMYCLSGGPLRHVVATAAALCPFVVAALYKYDYLRARFVGFLDPVAHAQQSGWHILQLQATLASGGMWGRSLGNTIWSRNYLPLGHSDSIFATIGESIGYAGVIPIVGIVVLWLSYCFRAAARQQLETGSLIIAGIGCMLAFQAFVHISVTVGLIPPTGITLPMISYGGSSLVSTMAAVGIILSFANNGDKALNL